MTRKSLRKVAFLDTNVLHFLDLYLRCAKDHGLFPFADDLILAEKHLNASAEYNALRTRLQQGLRTVVFFQRKSIRVEYSAFSELELMAGRAQGKAIVKAATEGIPDRMWSRLTDRDIGDRLLAPDLSGIGEKVKGLRSLLDEAGIDAGVGRTDRTRDVLELAKEVMGLVYMTPDDSMIYAGALVSEADHLISADAYFRNATTRLRTDKFLRATLKARIVAILSKDAESVILPDAKNVPSETA